MSLEAKLKHLYDTIREYREPKANRQLAFIFMKLPSKNVSTKTTSFETPRCNETIPPVQRFLLSFFIPLFSLHVRVCVCVCSWKPNRHPQHRWGKKKVNFATCFKNYKFLSGAPMQNFEIVFSGEIGLC